MVNCQQCNKLLQGNWAQTGATGTYVYTGITDGYMFSSGAVNYVRAYCYQCYQVVTKNYADTQLRTVNQNLTTEKNNLAAQNTNLNAQISDLKNKEANLSNQIATLTSEKSTIQSLNTTLTNEKNNLVAQNTNLNTQIGNLKTKETNLSLQITTLTSEKTTIQNLNATLTNEKNALTNEKNNFAKEITDLKNKITTLETSLNKANNDSLTFQNEAINYKKEIDVLNQTIKSLNSEISSIGTVKNDLNTNLTQLKTEKTVLSTEKNNLSKENQAFQTKIRLLEESLKNQANSIKDLQFDKDQTLFYDIVVDIESLRDLITSGWKINCSEEGRKRFESLNKENSCVCGAIGNYNKGKSFILHKLSEYEIPHGFSIQTKGISVKYPLNVKKAVTLLDTAGFETPLKFQKTPNSEEESKDLEEQRICDLARDRQLTELFLQKFVIEKSNILLIVVGMLTYSDQKLINRLKVFCKTKKIFIIHNLCSLIEKKQIEEYIDETLLKTFKLKQNKFIDFEETKDEQKINDLNDTYYVEDSENYDIVHLIVGRDGSQAGNYYNFPSFKYIKEQMQCYNKIKPFNLIDGIRNHLFDCSKELMEEESRIKNLEEIQVENDCIKLSTQKEILLKKCLVDELGFSKFYGNTFTPNYQFYKDDVDKKLVICADIPDLEKVTIPKSFIRGQHRVFTIKGQKSVESQEALKKKKLTVFENKRDFGNFSLDFAVLVQDAEILPKKPQQKYENGVLTLSYDLAEEEEESVITFSFDKK